MNSCANCIYDPCVDCIHDPVCCFSDMPKAPNMDIEKQCRYFKEDEEELIDRKTYCKDYKNMSNWEWNEE